MFDRHKSLAVGGERRLDLRASLEGGESLDKPVGRQVVKADVEAVVVMGPGEVAVVGAEGHCRPPGLEEAEVVAAGAVPDVGVASLTAGHDPAAVGGDQNLIDDAVAGRVR